MLRPRGDRIVVKADTGVETVGGVFIPEDAREKTQRATVLAVGSHADVADLNEGDTIVHAPYGGVPFNDPEHGDVLILRDSDVIAVVETA